MPDPPSGRLVTIDEIRAAQAALPAVVRRTPVLPVARSSAACLGVPIVVVMSVGNLTRETLLHLAGEGDRAHGD